MIKVGSDFSGAGAFNQALIRLGIEYKELFACDMDPHVRKTFTLNYGDIEYYPDNVYNREIPEESLDLYMTSPPCQAFSLAGNREGKNDHRGILFFNSLEFIDKNKPRFFIFENVEGLLSDDGGRTFQEWLNLLGGKSVNGVPVIFPYDDSVPYHIYWKVLNAKNYNVPQNRKRVFIIGIRDDHDNRFTWPVEESLKRTLMDMVDKEVEEKYYLSPKMIEYISHDRKGNKNLQLNKKVANAITCSLHKMQRSVQDNYIAEYGDKRLNETIEQNELPEGKIKALDLYNRKAHDNAPTLTEPHHNNTRLWDGYKIRKLTPRECFRLMDFPETFTWNCSDTQAYRMAGNSIVVGVLARIIAKLPL